MSDGAYRPFVFANCQLTGSHLFLLNYRRLSHRCIDDDAISFHGPSVGDIKVAVDEVHVHGHVERRSKANGRELASLKMNEREKKGVVHGTQ